MSTSATTPAATKYVIPPSTVAETAGVGAAFELGSLAGRPVLIILQIVDIIEQESLQVSVWGSADTQDWGAQPLFSFPQKFYREVTPAALNLQVRPEVKLLQVRWELNRWGRGYPRPHFTFAVEIQELH